MKARRYWHIVLEKATRALSIFCFLALFTIASLSLADTRAWVGFGSYQHAVDDAGWNGSLIQRRWRLSPAERERLKAAEEYYDELEDFYDDRDPRLADYYESLENYYEDLRKGKTAFWPPSAYDIQAPFVVPPGPYRQPALPQPDVRPRRDGLPSRQELQQRLLRPHDVLLRSYRQLQTELARLTTGERWQHYLSLPLDDRTDEDLLHWLRTENGRNELNSALEKYHRVQQDQTYDVVTGLGSFRRTYDALKSLIRWLQRQPAPAASEVLPPPEQIPLPPPSQEPTENSAIPRH